MKLLIDIPKEFEQHFRADRFSDSLHRLSADAHLLAGIFEQETALMLIEAFKNAVPVPPHGRLIDADALIIALETQDYSCAPDTLEEWTPMDMTKAEIADIRNAPTIIPAEEGER